MKATDFTGHCIVIEERIMQEDDLAGTFKTIKEAEDYIAQQKSSYRSMTGERCTDNFTIYLLNRA